MTKRAPKAKKTQSANKANESISPATYANMLMELEPRIAFDGAGDFAINDTVAASELSTAVIEPSRSEDLPPHIGGPLPAPGPLDPADDVPVTPEAQPTQIAFIDERVEDREAFLAQIESDYEVVVLDITRDGIEQIAQALAGREDVSAIHILSHGGAGELTLGTALLDFKSITGQYADLLAHIGSSLTADADILIYGCDFAGGMEGARAMQALAAVTGADIAGSNDLTGATRLEGDWELEEATGAIAASTITVESWDSVLAAPALQLPRQSNIVTNGGFEAGTAQPYVNGQKVAATLVQPVTGWYGGQGTASTAAEAGDPAHFGMDRTRSGKYMLEVEQGAAGQATTTPIWAETKFKTIIGETYEVTFWAMSRDFTTFAFFNKNDKGRVSVEGTGLSFEFGTSGQWNFGSWTGTAATNAGWTQFTTTFVAVATESKLRFTSLGSSGGGQAPAAGDQSGLMLDDVSVVQIPTAHYTTKYTEHDSPISAVNPGLLVTDPESNNINSARVFITNWQKGDILTVSSPVSGITITDYNPETGELLLSGNASRANYQSVLRSIQFSSPGDDPSTLTRIIHTTVTDANGEISKAAVTTITVEAINDAPVSTITPLKYVTAEDAVGPAALSLTGLSVTDVDAREGEITVTLSVDGSIGKLLAISGGGVAVGGSNTSQITLTGTLKAINDYLESTASAPKFEPAPNLSGDVTLTMITNDKGNTGAGALDSEKDTAIIAVTPVNDAPANTLPATFSTPEETMLRLNGLKVADVDADTGEIQVTLTVGSGTLKADSVTGAAAVAVAATGGGTNTIVLKGTLEAINAYLTNTAPEFTPALDVTGPVTLTMRTDDLGNTGPNALTDKLLDKLETESTATITVTPLNDPPVNAFPAEWRGNEDAGDVQLTGLSFTDDGTSSNTYSVRLSIPLIGSGAGTLVPGTGAGVNVARFDGDRTVLLTGTKDAINAYLASPGALTFRPTLNFNGTVELTMLTRDSTNTATNGGAGGEKQVSDKINIVIVPVNDAPTLTVPGAKGLLEDLVVDVNGPDVRVADVDSDHILTTTLSVGKGTLSVGTSSGAEITGQNSATVTLTGTATQINNALAGSNLKYRPTLDYNGTDTLTVTTTDGLSAPIEKTIAITIGAWDDIANPTYNTPEDTPITLTPLAGTPKPFENTDAAITAINGKAIVAGETANVEKNGVIVGTVTLNADNTLLFRPTANYFGNDNDFNYTVTSGGATETGRIRVHVSAVEEPPHIDLNSATEGTGYIGTFDQTPTAISNLGSIIDPDGAQNLENMTVSITGNRNAGDTLSVAGIPAGLSVNYAATTGVLTISGTRPLLDYVTVLNNTRFSTTSSVAGERKVDVAVWSAHTPKLSNIATATINVLDNDSDNVTNVNDIDDDNDGILDINEFDDLVSLGTVKNGSFTQGYADFKTDIKLPTSGEFSSWNGVTGTTAGLVNRNDLGAASNNYMMAKNFVESLQNMTAAQKAEGIVLWEQTVSTPQDADLILKYNFYNAGAKIDVLIDGMSVFGGPVTYPDISGLRQYFEYKHAFNSGSRDAVTIQFRLYDAPGNASSIPATHDFIGLDNIDVLLDSSDIDRDGLRNRLDLDSDSDGITDNVEAQATASYIVPTGSGANFVDADQDGLDDQYDANKADKTAAASVGLIAVNTDNADLLDFLDADADNDGRLDIAERGIGPTTITSTLDTDRDGLLDIFEGSAVSDGFDVNDENLTGTTFNLVDSDNDTNADGKNAAPRLIDLDFRDDVAQPAIDLDADNSSTAIEADYTTSYTEDGAAVSIAHTDITIVDLDSANISSATITLTNPAAGDQLLVNGSAAASGVLPSGISWTRTDSEVKLSGTFSKADYQAAIRLITFTNNSAEPATQPRKITVQLSDGVALSNIATATINIALVNDAPVNTVKTYTVDEDKSVPLSGLAIADVDAVDTSAMTVTLKAPTGTLSAVGAGGVTIEGTGTGTLVLKGTLKDINAYLAGAGAPQFAPPPNSTLAVTLTMQTNDLGNTGAGGAKDSTVDNILVTVTPVDDRPVPVAPGTPGTPTPPALPPGHTVAFDPLTGNYTHTIPEDTVANGQVAATDADGDTLSFALDTTTTTNKGTMTVLPNGTYSYTPQLNFTGTEVFKINVTAGGVTVVSTVTIVVGGDQFAPDGTTPLGKNDAPVNTVKTYTVDEDKSVPLSGLAIADVDAVDTSAMTVTLKAPTGTLSAVGAGGVTIEGTGTGTLVLKGTLKDINAYLAGAGAPQFAPPPNSTLAVTLTMQTNDLGNTGAGGAKDSTVDNILVTVTPVDDRPVPVAPGTPGTPTPPALPPGHTVAFDPLTGNYTHTIPEDTVANGQVAATDADGDTLSFALDPSTTTNKGTMTVLPNGTYSYTPQLNFTGTEVFKINVTAGGVTVVSTVTIVVGGDQFAPDGTTPLGKNDAPVNTVKTYTVDEDKSVPLSGLAIADVDAVDTSAMTVTLKAPTGTLSAVGAGGVTIEGTGTGTLVLKGTLKDINAYLAGAGAPQFAPPPNSTLAVTLTMQTNDLGNTGAGGAKDSTVDNILVTVTPVDDRPVPVAPGTPGTPTPPALPPGHTVAFDPLTGNYTHTIPEDTVANGQVAATDADGDTLSFALDPSTTTNKGTMTVLPNGTYSYTPPLNFTGTEVFKINVTAGGVTVVSTVTIVVGGDQFAPDGTTPLGKNDAPVNTVKTYTVDEDKSVPLSGLAIADVDAVDTSAMTVTLKAPTGTLSAVGAGGVTIEGTGTGTLVLKGTLKDINAYLAGAGAPQFAPPPNSTLAVTLTMQTNDLGNTGAGGAKDSTVDNILVTVTPVDDRPVPVAPGTPGTPTPPALPPGHTVAFDPLTGNYTHTIPEDTVANGQVAATDADGDTLSFALDTTTTTNKGTMTVLPNGTYSYTPQLNFTGTEVFKINVTAGGVTVVSTVTIVVGGDQFAPDGTTPLGKNDAPVNTVKTYTVDEDKSVPLSGLAIADVDAVDTSAMTVTLKAPTGTLSAVGAGGVTIEGTGTGTLVLKGTLKDINAYLAGAGAPQFAPPPNSTLAVTLTMQTNDLGNTGAGGAKDSTVDNILVTVTPVDDRPVPVAPGTPGTPTPPALPPGHTVAFDPLTGNYTHTIPEDTVANGQVAATDADGDTLSFALDTTTTTNKGTMTVLPNGTYSYTPQLNFTGTEVFKINVTAGGVTVVSTVTIVVGGDQFAPDGTTPLGKNDAPVNTVKTYTVDEDKSVPLSGLAIADVDAVDTSAMTVTLKAPTGTLSAVGAGGVTIEGTGTGTLVLKGTLKDINAYLAGAGAGAPQFAPPPNSTLAVTLTMQTNDLGNTGAGGAKDSTVDNILVTVTPVDDRPVPVAPGTPGTPTPPALPPGHTVAFDPLTGNYTHTIPEDTVANGQVAATDADGDTLSFALDPSTTTNKGTMTVLPNGTYSYTPPLNFTGTEVFKINVTAGGVTVVSTVTIVVGGDQFAPDGTTPLGKNDAPVNTVKTYTVDEDKSVPLSGLAIADVDAVDTSAMTVTLKAPTGTLSAVGAGGVTIEGTGTGTLVLKGTLKDINAYLAGAGAPQFAPPPNSTLAVTLTMQTNDLGNTGAGGAKDSTVDNILVTVTPVDDRPVPVAPGTPGTPTPPALPPGHTVAFDPLTGNYTHTIPEDTVANGQVAATDADGDTLSFALDTTTTTNKGTMTVLPNGTYSYTPPLNFTGTEVFKINVTAGGVTVVSTVTIVVGGDQFAPDGTTPLGKNDAPVNTVKTYTVDEDKSVPLSGLAIADVDAVDTSAMTVTLKAPTGTLSAVGAGGVTIEGTGTGTLVLKGTLKDINAYLAGAGAGAPQFAPPPNSTLAVTLTMQTNDLGNTGAGGAKDSTVDNILVTVTPVDDRPVPVAPGTPGTPTPPALPPGHTVAFDPLTGNYTHTIPEDTVANGQVAATDADGDTLSFALDPSTTTNKGTMTVLPNGTYSYTPPLNFTGTEVFKINVTAGGVTVVSTVTIVVGGDQFAPDGTTPLGKNDAPVNTVKTYTVDEDKSVPLSGLAIADVDAVDTSAMTVTLKAPTGTLSAVGAGGVTIEGTGTGTLVLKGTLKDINAYLAGAGAGAPSSRRRPTARWP